jgi:hypothetical protein
MDTGNNSRPVAAMPIFQDVGLGEKAYIQMDFKP